MSAPTSQLTATTILGGTIPEQQVVGQLYATQIANAVQTRNPEEKRMVVVGFGLGKDMFMAAADTDEAREAFFNVIELALSCL